MVVLSTSKEIENLKHPRKSKNPKFQFSKIPIFQKKTKKPKKPKKTILHRPWGEEGVRQSPGTIGFFVFLVSLGFLENWNFGKLEFWKIGILENWNFGKLEFWKLPLGEGGD